MYQQEMETTPVIIVGAGPSGLTLALSLALHKVKSVILEQSAEVTEDPRGVYLSGDSVRVLWSLGIQEELQNIGHELKNVAFHKSSLTNPAFYQLNTLKDWRYQAVPDGIMQIQPELERVLRRKVEESGFSELRCGCEVIDIQERQDGLIVEYRTRDGTTKLLQSRWLVGADGKRGYVRKHFLEPTAGVQQDTGLFKYEGTWIAANLHIKLPTSDSHPDFAPWKVGMTPDEVYDLFWPEGLHFVSPPGKPTASMRFGPSKARLWRHEFAEPEWNESKDAEKLLWEHLLPMLTRDQNAQGHKFPKATFPQDCIEIRRCAPYTFAQKVVNKWFHDRTILIGDAAHVFPPFGGQGITAGIRDAQALAWRLTVFENLSNLDKSTIGAMLNSWAHERRQGIDDSARFTKANGDMANEEEKWTRTFLRACITAIESFSIMPHLPTEVEKAEQEAYKPVKDGFFSSKHRGGGKIPQIYFRRNGEQPILSDTLLSRHNSLMTLVCLDNGDRPEVESLLDVLKLPQSIVSKSSIVQLAFESQPAVSSDVYRACSPQDLDGKTLREGYDSGIYRSRAGRAVKFVLLRPDFIIYSTAKTISELEQGLLSIKSRLGI